MARACQLGVGLWVAHPAGVGVLHAWGAVQAVQVALARTCLTYFECVPQTVKASPGVMRPEQVHGTATGGDGETFTREGKEPYTDSGQE